VQQFEVILQTHPGAQTGFAVVCSIGVFTCMLIGICWCVLTVARRLSGGFSELPVYYWDK